MGLRPAGLSPGLHPRGREGPSAASDRKHQTQPAAFTCRPLTVGSRRRRCVGQYWPGPDQRRSGGGDGEHAAHERSRRGRGGRSHRSQPLVDRRSPGRGVGDARCRSDLESHDGCPGLARDGSHCLRSERSENDLRGLRGGGVFGRRVRGQRPSQVDRRGGTWALLAASTFAGDTFSDIKVHPTNPDIVLAAITFGRAGRGGAVFPPTVPPRGIFRSTDGGMSWSQRQVGDATDLEVDPTNFDNQYAGIGLTSGDAEAIHRGRRIADLLAKEG